MADGDSPVVIDLFCGAGGSSDGLTQAGFRNELDQFRMLPADKKRLLEFIRQKMHEKNDTLRAGANRADGEIERIKQLQSALAVKNVDGIIPVSMIQ